LRKRAGDRDHSVARVEATDNAAAVELSWTDADGRRASFAQALILRDGRIVHIQDFADPANAFRAIRR
jgi:ketosteroid isomerase-like protein